MDPFLALCARGTVRELSEWLEARRVGSHARFDKGLEEACANGNVEVMHWLMQGPMRDRLSAPKLLELLVGACFHCQPESVRLLLKRCPLAAVRTFQRDDIGTLLHLATHVGNLEIVRLLVEEAGMDCNTKTALGDPVLQLAVRRDHVDIARYLCDRGARVHEEGQFEIVLLPIAISRRFDDMASLLLEYGAWMNGVLQLAVECELRGTMERLLTRPRDGLIREEIRTACLCMTPGWDDSSCRRLLLAEDLEPPAVEQLPPLLRSTIESRYGGSIRTWRHRVWSIQRRWVLLCWRRALVVAAYG
jgi:hypothetical protein